MQDSRTSSPFREPVPHGPDQPVQLSAPTKVCLSVTSRCNLDCRHCLAKTVAGGPELSTRELFRIIEEMAAAKVFFVSLFGGEPFLRPDILEVTEFLSRFPIGIAVNTNATLIDRELADRLSRYRISYVVSLDGASARTVDPIRGQGVFEKTLAGIRALRRHGARILLSTTVMSHNYGDLANIVALGRELGVMGVRVNTVFFINNAECYSDDIALAPDQYAHLFRTFRDLKNTYGKFLSGSLFQFLESVQAINDHGLPAALDRDEIRVEPCGAGVNQCAVRPDGEVLPCVLLWNTPAGNLRERPLREIWEHSETLARFRRTFTLTAREIPDCISCPYRYICYTGHRCSPYYIPGGTANRKLFCVRAWMTPPRKA